MTEAEKKLRAIERNAAKRKKIETDHAATREMGDQLIIEAAAEGATIVALSKAAQMTRPTIYTILLRAEAGR